MRSERGKGLEYSAWILGGLLVIVSVFQLRPFRFDTRAVAVALEAFERDRTFLMNAGLLRIIVVFPATVLAVELWHRFARPITAAFILVGGVLSVVAGVAQVLLGIPAEELRSGPADTHAIEVVGDVLYWAHDNFATLAGLTFTTGAFAFSLWMRRERVSNWWVYSGLAALPLLATSTLSWYFTVADDAAAPTGRHTPTLPSPIADLWYACFAIAALVAFLAWLGGLARWRGRFTD